MKLALAYQIWTDSVHAGPDAITSAISVINECLNINWICLDINWIPDGHPVAERSSEGARARIQHHYVNRARTIEEDA